MAYDVIFDNVGSTAYPPQLSSTFDAVDYPNVFTTPFLAHGGIFPGSLASGGNLSQADARAATSSYIYDQKLPYSIQWNFGVQHVFLKDYTFEARYLGTRGVHLLGSAAIRHYCSGHGATEPAHVSSGPFASGAECAAADAG